MKNSHHHHHCYHLLIVTVTVIMYLHIFRTPFLFIAFILGKFFIRTVLISRASPSKIYLKMAGLMVGDVDAEVITYFALWGGR